MIRIHRTIIVSPSQMDIFDKMMRHNFLKMKMMKPLECLVFGSVDQVAVTTASVASMSSFLIFNASKSSKAIGDAMPTSRDATSIHLNDVQSQKTVMEGRI